MSRACENLPAFHVGELDDEGAAAMRRHLAFCQHCQRELEQLLLEEIVTHPEGSPLPLGLSPEAMAFLQDPVPIRPGRLASNVVSSSLVRRAMRPARAVAVAMAVPAAALLVWFVIPNEPAVDSPASSLVSVLGPSRSIEVRLGGADAHRPYDVKRASPSAGEDIPLTLLAELERRGDRSSLFAAFMLRGDLVQAGKELERVPPGAGRDSDRAALELASGHPEAALAHAARAVEQEPRLGRALWNAAVARRQLDLPLGAAAWFERVAELGEPGWASEAMTEARRLRATRAGQRDRAKRARSEATRLADERVPMDIDLARLVPDVARKALIEALRGATPGEAALLGPLADTIDQAQGTSSLGAQVRSAAGGARGRGPLAAEYARLARVAAGASPPAAEAWVALARRARGAGAQDIELGAIARAAEKDRRLYPQLVDAARRSQDPWLHAWAAEEQARDLIYAQRRFAAAEPVLVQALEVCPALSAPSQCGMLEALLAASLAAQGRAELARLRIERARTVAAPAQDSIIDSGLLQIAAEIAVGRDPAAADPVSLAAAFTEELALLNPDCRGELYGLDYITLAALDMNRLDEARRFSDQAQELRRGRCSSTGPRINEAMARARLLQHRASEEDLAQLRADLVEMRANDTVGERALADYVEGMLTIARQRADGEALLHRAIAAGAEAPDELLAGEARRVSFVALALDAGRRGDFRAALDRLAEAEERPEPAGCRLGVVGQDGVAVVVAMDSGGQVHGAYRSQFLAPGSFIPAMEDIVPPPLRSALSSCAVVDVLALGAYYGRARLLPPEMAWRYRSSAARGDRRAVPGIRLVVTGVEPPAWLRLPALRDEVDETGAIVVRGSTATPRRVLLRMGEAAEIEIHAHGLVDATEPNAASLALSPDADGDYALTADRVRGVKLPLHPLVILAACDAGRTPHGGRRWGLADAFLVAGARSVVASTASIPDSGMTAMLAELTANVRRGKSVAESVRDVRLAHPDRDWLNDIVVFE